MNYIISRQIKGFDRRKNDIDKTLVEGIWLIDILEQDQSPSIQ